MRPDTAGGRTRRSVGGLQRALGVATVGMLVVASCTGGGDDDTREGLPIDPFTLEVEVGDCFDRPESPDTRKVPTVDCDEPHDLEAFARVDLDGDRYPGDEAIADEARSRCNEPFAEYVGVRPRDSGLVIIPVAPTAEAWDQGERTVTCSATVREDEPLVGSVRNSETPDN